MGSRLSAFQAAGSEKATRITKAAADTCAGRCRVGRRGVR